MVWFYLLVATAGVVLLVPTWLQTLDGKAIDGMVGAAAFWMVAFGLAGIVGSQMTGRFIAHLIAALAVGGAAAALHPEIIAAIRRRGINPDDADTATSPTSVS